MESISEPKSAYFTLSGSRRWAIIGSALLALFLAAMDALVVSAAMPTIVAELGGLYLFSWVYTAFMLTRTITLPISGKLADIFGHRRIFLWAIALFIVASIAAGASPNMPFLIAARTLQGIASGGVFALVYIVLTDVSNPEKRGQMLGIASSMWGIASIIGPALGGFLTTYLSWRSIFWINIPLGIASFWGIGVNLKAHNVSRKNVQLDIWGGVTLTVSVLAFLFALLHSGSSNSWLSVPFVTLMGISVLCIYLFIRIEKRTSNPILSIGFFANRYFTIGNAAIFLGSFAIFGLIAYAPLFLQAVQGHTPMQVGAIMLALSFSWSMSSVIVGQFIQRLGTAIGILLGAIFVVLGCAAILTITPHSSMIYCICCFFIMGIGMGFLSLSALMTVQASVSPRDIGIATASNQFARNLGGTVGVGISGGIMGGYVATLMSQIKQTGFLERLPQKLSESGLDHIENMLQPGVQALLPDGIRNLIRTSIEQGTYSIFRTLFISAVLALIVSLFIFRKKNKNTA